MPKAEESVTASGTRDSQFRAAACSPLLCLTEPNAKLQRIRASCNSGQAKPHSRAAVRAASAWAGLSHSIWMRLRRSAKRAMAHSSPNSENAR